MTTWRPIEGASTGRRGGPASVTIGTFDGVHRGHQEVLRRTRAAAPDLPVVAVTFDPHPVAVIAPDRVPLRLTSVERRVELLRRHGADEVRVLAFSREMSGWTPEEFVRRALVEDLHAATVVVGENFRFGAKAAGDVDLLHRIGPDLGFEALGLRLVGDGSPWSSTRVRELVAEADLAGAADILGRPHEVDGVVTPGDQRGRDLGFPTANVPVDDGYAVPPDGVYAGRLVVGRGGGGAVDVLPAAISIGTNPTFAGVERRVESYVIDHGHELELYDRSVRVELVEQLRGMTTYEGVEPLVEQMHRDVEAARSRLAAPGPS